MIGTLSFVVVAACGSGGPDSSAPGAGTSSGGSSSGSGAGGSGGSSGTPVTCEATCGSEATIELDEDNTGDRLVGALFEVCLRDYCERGRLEVPDAGGTPFEAKLASSADSNWSSVALYASVSPADATKLRIRVMWSLAKPSPEQLTSDVYSVSARVSEEGAELFNRSFPAVYKKKTVCTVECHIFKTGP